MAGTGRLRKYLIFNLSGERFAVPLNQVKEVIGLPRLTPVPQAESYMKGLINLRGRVITTIDLRERLQLAPSSAEVTRPCVIISEWKNLVIGSIVDEIQEVQGITEDQIERNLEIRNAISREYLIGAARIEGKPLTLVLDIDRVLGGVDVQKSQGAA